MIAIVFCVFASSSVRARTRAIASLNDVWRAGVFESRDD